MIRLIKRLRYFLRRWHRNKHLKNHKWDRLESVEISNCKREPSRLLIETVVRGH